MLEERMTVPGTSLGAMIEAISALEDAVFGVSDNAASFVRWSRPVYIEFFI